MLRLVLVRLAAAVPVLVGVTFLVFSLTLLIPGDPVLALLGQEATPEDQAVLRKALGLDQPIPVQYARWIGRVASGDLGNSILMREPVSELLAKRFQNTMVLALSALLIALVIGLPAGVLSAAFPRSILDRVVMFTALFGNSMPIFWLGLMLILIFSVQFGWLPTSGMSSVRGDGGPLDLVRHTVMPAFTLSTISAAMIARMTRSSMLEVLSQEYIVVARAKGLPRWKVIVKHGLRNALLPVITVVALQAGSLLGGAVVTETVFSWPGVGLQMYQAISARDLPVIQGGVLLLSSLFVFFNLLADLLYARADPRVRYQ